MPYEHLFNQAESLEEEILNDKFRTALPHVYLSYVVNCYILCNKREVEIDVILSSRSLGRSVGTGFVVSSLTIA